MSSSEIRGKRAERREKRVGDSTLGIWTSQNHDDKEKKEESREKGEERGEKKEERC